MQNLYRQLNLNLNWQTKIWFTQIYIIHTNVILIAQLHWLLERRLPAPPKEPHPAFWPRTCPPILKVDFSNFCENFLTKFNSVVRKH